MYLLSLLRPNLSTLVLKKEVATLLRGARDVVVDVTDAFVNHRLATLLRDQILSVHRKTYSRTIVLSDESARKESEVRMS